MYIENRLLTGFISLLVKFGDDSIALVDFALSNETFDVLCYFDLVTTNISKSKIWKSLLIEAGADDAATVFLDFFERVHIFSCIWCYQAL